MPGTWVLAPEVGFLWTPGYWGWGGGGFVFYQGYWGPQVGFYGGIDYGFGYFGHGYEGGRWDNGHFFYNRSVNNVNVTVVHNVYDTESQRDARYSRELQRRERRINERPTARKRRHRANGISRLSRRRFDARKLSCESGVARFRKSRQYANRCTAKPGKFEGGGAVKARGGSANVAVHPNDLPPAERMAAPNTGDAKLDKKYQQQQDKLSAQQNQERQKLQQQQDKEHEQLAKRNASDASKQQLEQKHQQQTQQLVQKHTEQQQQLQQKQQPARSAQASRPPEERSR